MASKQKTTNEPEFFEQVEEASGRVRLDRRFNGAEAAAQDAENRERRRAVREETFTWPDERRR